MFLNINFRIKSLCNSSVTKYFLVASDHNDSYYRQEFIQLAVSRHLFSGLFYWLPQRASKIDSLKFIYLKIRVNPFHANIYFMKNNYLPKNLMRRMFYIFANLFNVWLNRRQLDSSICLTCTWIQQGSFISLLQCGIWTT